MTDYITYEFAIDYLGIKMIDLEFFIATTGFPSREYRMVHESILWRFRKS